MWFDFSEPVRTTPQIKQTLGEGVLHVFGVVRVLRTSWNYTSAQANTWRGYSTRCSVWFDPSEPLRTTPQHKETLGEGVLHLFGVVQT